MKFITSGAVVVALAALAGPALAVSDTTTGAVAGAAGGAVVGGPVGAVVGGVGGAVVGHNVQKHHATRHSHASRHVPPKSPLVESRGGAAPS